VYGKWHISNEKRAGSHPSDFGFDEAFESHGKHYNAVSTPAVDQPDGVTIEEVYTDKALEFMRAAVEKDQPFFIFMPSFLVHSPYEAAPELIAHFEEKMKGVELLSQPDKKIAVIAAMTKMLDQDVGRLLAQIKELGIEENTIVVFTSDNGSYNKNLVGDYRGTKGQVYDGGMRVPYLFKWPGKIQAGSLTDERITGLDLFPTFLGLAGIPVPQGCVLDGIDLSPLLLGKQKQLPERSIYCYFPKYARFSKKSKTWGDAWRNVIYDGDYKLIQYPDYGRAELFDLAKDPFEKEDLANENPEKRALLEGKLNAWLKDLSVDETPLNPNFEL
jgi:arylsulfatase A-like enzyme